MPPWPSPRHRRSGRRRRPRRPPAPVAPRGQLPISSSVASAARMGDGIGGPAQHPDHVRRPQQRPRPLVGVIDRGDGSRRNSSASSPRPRHHHAEPPAAVRRPRRRAWLRPRRTARRGRCRASAWRAGQRPGTARDRAADRSRAPTAPAPPCAADRRPRSSAPPSSCGQLPAQLRQVHLPGRGPAQFAEQRVGQRWRAAGRPTRSTRDQMHLLGGLQILPRRPAPEGRRDPAARTATARRATSACSGGSRSSRLPTRSLMFCETATSPSQIQTPATRRIRPAATWSLTNCWMNSALPPVSRQNRLRAAGVHRPAQAWPRPLARVRSGDSGSRSSRASSPSRHNALTASGSPAPVRTVTTRRASRVWASLVHDVRGEPVEQMGVIDTDQHSALTLLCDKGIDHPTHTGRRFGERHRRVPTGEGAQRNRPRRGRAHDPVGPGPRRRGLGEQLASQSRLADTRRRRRSPHPNSCRPH